ncbi:MAG: POTRA domain-containing protein [Candidatus Acidiferrales bacterium]
MTGATLCASMLSAQIPERCRAHPTPAEEARAMRAKAPHRIVAVDSLDLKDAHAAPELAQQLVEALQSREFDADSNWPAQVAEQMVRDAWQRRGYFRVMVKADYKVLSNDKTQARVSLALRVTPGLPYRLADLQFAADDRQQRAPMFAPAVLRPLFPLDEGDIFDVDKIRQGLEALKKLYASAGYIDMVAQPEFSIDDAKQRIILKVFVDEGSQFVVEKIAFLGLTSETRSRLQIKLKAGYVYDHSFVEDFFADNRALLPAGASPGDVNVTRNPQTRTLTLLFDFRSCDEFLPKSR